MWENLRQALAFLTRFPARPKPCDPIACIPFFLPAGLLLGLFLTLVSLLVELFFASNSYGAFLAAFFWLSLEVWCTRALHWDGLADLTDALGSGAHGPRFLEVLRDSRIGSFGAMALILVFLGHFLAISLHILQHNYLVLVFAPAFARAVPVLLCHGLEANAGSSLGLIVLQALTRYNWLFILNLLFVLFLSLGLALWQSSWHALLLLPGLTLLCFFLRNTARREGGISGDYCGAAIELAQLGFLFSLL